MESQGSFHGQIVISDSVGQAQQEFPIGIFLVLETFYGRVHINGESDNDIEADDNTKVIEDDEKEALASVPITYVNVHLNDYLPIIDHHQNEQGYHRRTHVVEVHKEVVVWDGAITDNLW